MGEASENCKYLKELIIIFFLFAAASVSET